MKPQDNTTHVYQIQEDVVTNVEGKRQVPARPEDRRRDGGKRPLEILGHPDAQSARRANRDMRVSREIKKKLHPVAEGETPYVWAGPARRVVESGNNAVAGQNALAQQFGELQHEGSDRDSSKALDNFRPRRGSLGAEL